MSVTMRLGGREMTSARAEKEFRERFIVEAVNALMVGKIDFSKSLIRDYLNVTQSFAAVADRLQKDEKSIRRMLSPSGNPSLKNFIIILQMCRVEEHLKLKVLYRY